MKKSAYAKAGVDIDEMMSGLTAVKRMVRQTAVKGVVGDMGSFGGLFAAPGKDHLLVASTDGVGTKLKVALMADRHTTVGADLVNHCINDILVQGAKPLFFLDYLGISKLTARMLRDVVAGLCRACRANGCALLGGETAEMPGLYPPAEYDLVGTIIGAVEKKRLVTGSTIRPGDVIVGLPSSGLHTNGYSLARKVIFEQAGLEIRDTFPGTKRTVADVLLAVHKSYLDPVTRVLARTTVRGMVHITGGGFTDNIRRVLPPGTGAVVNRDSWNVPAVFEFIRKRGRVDRDEMYRVFNMGIGFLLILRPADAEKAIGILRRARARPRVVGSIRKGRRKVVLE